MNLCTRTLCVKLNLLSIDPDDPRHIPWSMGFDKDRFVSPGDIVVMVEIWSLESLDGGDIMTDVTTNFILFLEVVTHP